MRTALVTGVAGFVGMATAARLLRDGWRVVGFDNLNDYYDVSLKEARLENLRGLPQGGNFVFHKLDLADAAGVLALVMDTKPEVVIHLGAQASVRYGMKNQKVYLESNLVGHFNILAACKALNEAAPGHMPHLLYASSSSVYGGNEKVPFEETDDVSSPQSLYAATKRADELVTHAWVNQFVGTPGAFAASGMRFFTVYGPWGRPDMSAMLFAHAILEGKPIQLFNKGDLWRDFTFIDDIVEAIVQLIPARPAGKVAHEVYNLGNQNPVRMDTFVEVMAKAIGKEPVVDLREWPPTEVYKTYASTAKLQAAVGWVPATALDEGLAKFVTWYKPRHGTIRV